MIKLLILV